MCVKQRGFCAIGGPGAVDRLEIVVIHGEDQVEVAEVGRHDLARPLAGIVIAAPRRRPQPARIGRIADMPGAGAGAIDMPVEAAVSGHRAGNAIGGG